MRRSSLGIFIVSALATWLTLQAKEVSAFVRSQSAYYCVPLGTTATWGWYSLKNESTTTPMYLGCGVPNDTNLFHGSVTALNVRGYAWGANTAAAQACIAKYAGPDGSTGGACGAWVFSTGAGWYNLTPSVSVWNGGSTNDAPYVLSWLSPAYVGTGSTLYNTMSSYRITN